MKVVRMFGALAVLGAVTGLAYVGQRAEPAGARMAVAAKKLLASFQPDQKTRAVFPYDGKERTHWFFVPLQDKQKRSTRKGVPLEDMNPGQKKLALALVQAGTSPAGNTQAVTIMSLEAILREQEKKGAMVRNPEWYFFTLFGNPGDGKWGWRVEGHHLSLNFTLNGDQVVASTPTFFGANPAEIKGGPKKGHRTLGEAENLAFKLFQSLDEDQRKIAHQPKQFPEIKQATIEAGVGPPRGLPAAKMTQAQRDILLNLLKSYTRRMPPDVAEVEMKAALKDGIEAIHFAFSGAAQSGKKHTYRVQGSAFVIEFLNEQADSAGNTANHIHSVWRRMKGDFGL